MNKPPLAQSLLTHWLPNKRSCDLSTPLLCRRPPRPPRPRATPSPLELEFQSATKVVLSQRRDPTSNLHYRAPTSPHENDGRFPRTCPRPTHNTSEDKHVPHDRGGISTCSGQPLQRQEHHFLLNQSEINLKKSNRITIITGADPLLKDFGAAAGSQSRCQRCTIVECWALTIVQNGLFSLRLPPPHWQRLAP